MLGPPNPLLPAGKPAGAAGLAAGPRSRGVSRYRELRVPAPAPGCCSPGSRPLPRVLSRRRSLEGNPGPARQWDGGDARGEPGDARGSGSGPEEPRMLSRCPAGAGDAAAIAPAPCVSLPRGIPPRVSVPVSSAVARRVEGRSGRCGGTAVCPCSLPGPTGHKELPRRARGGFSTGYLRLRAQAGAPGCPRVMSAQISSPLWTATPGSTVPRYRRGSSPWAVISSRMRAQSKLLPDFEGSKPLLL